MPGGDPNHPDSPDLAAFGLGRMDAARSAIIEAHVLGCDSCTRRCSGRPMTRGSITSAGRRRRPTPVRRRN